MTAQIELIFCSAYKDERRAKVPASRTGNGTLWVGCSQETYGLEKRHAPIIGDPGAAALLTLHPDIAGR